MSRAARFLGRAVLSSAGVATLAACNAVCNFAPCDAWTEVTVRNDCGYSVEVAARPAGNDSLRLYPRTLAVGAEDALGETAGSLDLYVRPVGSTDWPVVVSGEDIDAAAPNAGDVFVLTGTICPAGSDARRSPTASIAPVGWAP